MQLFRRHLLYILLFFGLASTAPAFSQQTLSYPTFQNYQAQTYQYEPSQQSAMPMHTYSTYQKPNNYTYQNQPVQQYKRAPRMSYQDSGHRISQNPLTPVRRTYQAPRHYQTYRKPVQKRPQYNKYAMRQNLLRVFMGGSPSFNSSRGGRGRRSTASDGSAVDRAYNQRSVALSEADSAEACADRASYGNRNTRQDAAYEARSHANIARTAAEKAQSASSQGPDEARGYAQDAWAAADRADSAASRAQSDADRGRGGW